MNGRATTLLQRVTAGFFLALFLFIHLAKFAHHHDCSTVSVSEKGYTKHVASNSNCSICDYHFTKDSAVELPTFSLQKLTNSPVLYTDYLSQRLTSIGLTSSGRGPPSLV